MFFYPAKIMRVIDGDTLELLIDQGFRQYRREKVRLLSCDAPEVRGKEKLLGLEVEQKLTEFLDLYDNDVFIHTVKQDSFGRWLGMLYVDNERKGCINEKVVQWTEDAYVKRDKGL